MKGSIQLSVNGVTKYWEYEPSTFEANKLEDSNITFDGGDSDDVVSRYYVDGGSSLRDPYDGMFKRDNAIIIDCGASA